MNESNRIVAVAHDPGGACMLAPVIAQLLEEKFDVRCVGRGPALKIWGSMGWNVYGGVDGYTALKAHLTALSPGLVITGTSVSKSDGYGTDIDRDAWKVCRELNVPCVSGIDAPMNIRLRFYDGSSHMYQQPDNVFLCDDEALEEFNRIEEIISVPTVVGQPHLEKIIRQIVDARKTYQQGEYCKVAVFFSEPVRLGIPVEEWPNFTQFDIADHVLAVVEELSIDLVIKPHPHEDVDEWRAYVENRLENIISPGSGRVTISEQSPLEIFSFADVVLGIGSMVLNEAGFSGIPSVAIQPDVEKNLNPTVDRNINVVKLTNSSSLRFDLLDILKSKLSAITPAGNISVLDGSCRLFVDKLKPILEHKKIL